ncbi:plasmid pRiA4b ORF-3 family protein [Georgenia sp. Z1491]|uniref:plasmid pRiA4b ORF-3 family protein n=1 Tax=Georgenia sp. Z1491 TaxID=3416707 RepID=UPI003CFB4E0E
MADALRPSTLLDQLRAGDRSRLQAVRRRPRPDAPATGRPEHRRPPRQEARTFRLLLHLDQSDPPIWRLVDVRSDLTLDAAHRVIQAAFGWEDRHLHRFSLGGYPFDLDSQLFLCPFDLEEKEPDDDGSPAADVRLDETLQEPADVLRYVYDYGDSWEVTVVLSAVLDVEPGSPVARFVDGERAAPPEDSGGAVDRAALALVLDDPDHLDVAAVDASFASPPLRLTGLRADPRLVDLLVATESFPPTRGLAGAVADALESPSALTDAQLADALTPHRWFLDRAADEPIRLTSAGYLRPGDVMAVAPLVPTLWEWIGANNRESHAIPLLELRRTLRTHGLLRTVNGELHLTNAGRAAQNDPRLLWEHLATRLVPAGTGFDATATLLLLAHAAATPDRPPAYDVVGSLLGDLGWVHDDGTATDGYDVRWLPASTVLRNMVLGGRPQEHRSLLGDRPVGAAAGALARDTLLGTSRSVGAATHR